MMSVNTPDTHTHTRAHTHTRTHAQQIKLATMYLHLQSEGNKYISVFTSGHHCSHFLTKLKCNITVKYV